MSSRAEMLAAIRAQLPRQRPAPQPPPLPAGGDVSVGTAERIAGFGERLGAVGARLHVATEQRPAAAILTALLQPFAAGAVGWSDAAALAPLRAAVAPQRPGIDAERPLADLLGCEVGVTMAQWGIAAAGTLVLQGGEERHRLLSLLPPVHIALLPASRLLATLGEALKLLPRPLPAAVTFVTGPSRTADIELQLVIGVHGPRQLHVVLL